MESESSAKLCNFVCKESGKKFSLTSGETNATKLGQLFRLLPASIVVVDVKSRRTFFPDDGGKLEIPYAEGEFEVEGDSLHPVPTLITRDAKSVRGGIFARPFFSSDTDGQTIWMDLEFVQLFRLPGCETSIHRHSANNVEEATVDR